jgi:hypothetical protein
MQYEEKGKVLKFKDLIRRETERIEKMKYENKNYSPVKITLRTEQKTQIKFLP